MKETKNYYTSSNYADHTTYGGEIHDYDFNTEYKKEPKKHEGSSIAARILSDIKFDNMCKANIENRKRIQECKEEVING